MLYVAFELLLLVVWAKAVAGAASDNSNVKIRVKDKIFLVISKTPLKIILILPHLL